MQPMKPLGLARAERLRSLAAIRRLFNDGASGFIYPYRYMVYIEKSATPNVEVLFSVPKRFHKRANKRNLLRRRTKEAYRLHRETLHTFVEHGLSIDMALVYSAKEVLPYKTLDHAITRILAEVAKRY